MTLQYPKTWGSFACSSTYACHQVRLFSVHSSANLFTSLRETHSLNISWPWFFKKHPENCLFVTKVLRVYSLQIIPYRLRLCGETDDSACLLCSSPLLPFLWSDSSFNILPPFSSFPPWQTSLEPVIFLLILSLGRGGGRIFTRAAALTLFKSSEPRYLWLYLLNWVLSRLSSRQSPLTRFIAFWESLLAKL